MGGGRRQSSRQTCIDCAAASLHARRYRLQHDTSPNTSSAALNRWAAGQRFCPSYLFILLRLSACRACTPSAPHQNQGCTEEPRQDADDSSSSFDCPSFSPPLSLIVPPAAPITINLPASQPQPRGLAAAAAINCDPVSVLFPFIFFVFSLHVLRQPSYSSVDPCVIGSMNYVRSQTKIVCSATVSVNELGLCFQSEAPAALFRAAGSRSRSSCCNRRDAWKNCEITPQVHW